MNWCLNALTLKGYGTSEEGQGTQVAEATNLTFVLFRYTERRYSCPDHTRLLTQFSVTHTQPRHFPGDCFPAITGPPNSSINMNCACH